MRQSTASAMRTEHAADVPSAGHSSCSLSAPVVGTRRGPLPRCLESRGTPSTQLGIGRPTASWRGRHNRSGVRSASSTSTRPPHRLRRVDRQPAAKLDPFGAASNRIAPPVVPARANHRSWRHANAARRRRGRRKAVAMLTMKLNRLSARGIAETFATTPGAVYVRLHRLRSGYYGT